MPPCSCPVLQMCVSGEANSIRYDVGPQFFDCGLQSFDRAVEKELVVTNSGKVVNEWAISCI